MADELYIRVFDGLSVKLREKWVERLENAYGESTRCYHTLSHVRSMLDTLYPIAIPLELTSQGTRILQFAIWFHDVVYDSTAQAGYNEIKSTLLFDEFAREINLVIHLGV
jgi:predicted metal-dependent HD superfamily phosphohydrolase